MCGRKTNDFNDILQGVGIPKLHQILIKVLCEQTRELTHDFLDYV